MRYSKGIHRSRSSAEELLSCLYSVTPQTTDAWCATTLSLTELPTLVQNIASPVWTYYYNRCFWHEFLEKITKIFFTGVFFRPMTSWEGLLEILAKIRTFSPVMVCMTSTDVWILEMSRPFGDRHSGRHLKHWTPLNNSGLLTCAEIWNVISVTRKYLVKNPVSGHMCVEKLLWNKVESEFKLHLLLYRHSLHR